MREQIKILERRAAAHRLLVGGLPPDFQLERRVAYYRMFLNAAGGLTADAKLVLDDLYEFTKMFGDVPVDNHAALAMVEGSRKVVLHILERLNQPNNEGVSSNE
jgi:hypothetical protein